MPQGTILGVMAVRDTLALGFWSQPKAPQSPSHLGPLPVLDHAGKHCAAGSIGALPEADGHGGQQVVRPHVVTLSDRFQGTLYKPRFWDSRG